MRSFILEGTVSSPEIRLLPDENIFMFSGRSAPEDVRAIYYPVLDWMDEFTAGIKENNPFSSDNPLLFRFDFEYFNSSSAKFLYDIIYRLKQLYDSGVPVVINWYHDEEDTDLRDAGEDLAILLGMEFIYCPR